MTDEELSKCLEIEAERDIAKIEIERLRAALTKIAFYDGFMDKEAATTMLVTAREALKLKQP